MADSGLTNSRIVASYKEKTPGSATLAKRASELLPSGIAHDARYVEPYGIYVDRAEGPHKWDIDGNRYVDYFGGHGALLLGHNHPKVIEATRQALEKGTHFGANHEAEVRWAEAIQRLVPSAERVRFTSSGTEATLMAVRLARAFTARDTLVRFKTHFHGWHDHMTSGYASHFDGSATPGVLEGVAGKVMLLDPWDIEAVRACLTGNDDIAAVILEPTGGSFGLVPMRPEFVRELRDLTEKHGVVLIFDEVVTGFRVSSGGAQAAFGVRPDLSSFAKIVAGGLPGAAVAGRKEILDRLDFAATRRQGQEKIQHPGTYNANPVSAAAGVAALEVIGTSDACTRANDTAANIRSEINEVLERQGVPWAVYGTYSGFHLFMNPKGRAISPGKFDPYSVSYDELKALPTDLANKLRLAMLVNGVDVTGRIGGVVSASHGPEDVAATRAAFEHSIEMLKREGELPA
ncbi:MAG TPA: aspartate aminotransferase family protein [Alphaproteobacteria bacterium]|nr:aspartate aminotransferase family protein [Alphaproteobacteria bacterium]